MLAILVIGLMLTAYFQSPRLSLSVLSVLPGIGRFHALLWLTGNTDKYPNLLWPTTVVVST